MGLEFYGLFCNKKDGKKVNRTATMAYLSIKSSSFYHFSKCMELGNKVKDLIRHIENRKKMKRTIKCLYLQQ